VVTVLFGNGSGGFKLAPGSPFDLGHHPWNVIIADVNGDTMMDLVMRSPNNYITVLLGNNSGSFMPAPGSPFAVGTDPFSIALGDINADGKIDIITANSGSNNVTLWLGKRQ
jgi:FG-GAP-like repeat